VSPETIPEQALTNGRYWIRFYPQFQGKNHGTRVKRCTGAAVEPGFGANCRDLVEVAEAGTPEHFIAGRRIRVGGVNAFGGMQKARVGDHAGDFFW
jgi:hypothetical protein